MKYSHLFATIIVLVSGTAAQDLGNKYTKFVPEDPAGSGGVTWSYNGTKPRYVLLVVQAVHEWYE
jgi:hypothetical protein